MKIEPKELKESTLVAVVTLLNGEVPELTAESLVEALKQFGAEEANKPKSDRLITRKEAARLLSVSMPTFWRMEKNGAIQTVSLPTGGRRVREHQIVKILEVRV